MPFRLPFALFLIVPVLEMYLLIKVGSLIGALPAILAMVLAAVLGVALLRTQGFATLQRVRQSLARGELPAREMLEGVVLFAGGVLLLAPGFLTDALGLLCLVPAMRRYLVTALLRHQLNAWVVVKDHRWESGHGPRTIEGEFHRDD